MNEMIRFIKGDFSTVPNKKALRGLSAVERSVYLSICDHADQEGVCFPSRGLLAKESSVSEKTVDRALKILVEKGFLDKKAVFTTTGGQTSNTYQMLIMSPGGDDFSYASFSQGERARINLSILFTWRDVTSKVSGVDLSLLVLDECFDGPLDKDGSFAVKGLLDGVNGNLIVISHQDLDPEDFDRHIVMSKVGRFSKMEIKKS